MLRTVNIRKKSILIIVFSHIRLAMELRLINVNLCNSLLLFM